MKRRTTPTLEVVIEDLNLQLVDHIDFLFKQTNSETDTVKLKKTYPGAVTYDSAKGVFLIPFSESDSCTFKAGAYFYLDTRIVLNGGKVPETEIVSLVMRGTLFEAGDTT